MILPVSMTTMRDYLILYNNRPLRRDAADLQERDGDARRHRALHVAIRRRSRHHVDAASHARDTDRNGCRPSAATSITTTTSRLVSPDSRGQPPRSVASRARRTTIGRPVCSRSSGMAMGLSVYAQKPTTVLVRPTSVPRKA